ncbi:MAG: rhodanese-like domain-containing protein [Actinomycetota bacterium]
MLPTTTLKTLDLDEALARVDDGAAFVDLRPIDDYLQVHVPGSIALLYEFGPGMAGRARDCLPLELPLLLLSSDNAHMANTAAALRGKGFTVLGRVDHGVNAWASAKGAPASTEVVTHAAAPDGTLLDVGDPGARRPDSALHIPIEKLWSRAADVARDRAVIVVAGFAVRAALAVGMLERCGRRDIVFWRTRDKVRLL